MSERLPLVWIVDDSRTEALFTQSALGGGYHFELFSDGSVVVERLAGNVRQPDVILLDWVMPGMSGDQVCRFLREHPKTRELPLILVTASRIETSDVVHGLAAGANDYVARPFVPEELRARVDSVLRARAASLAAARERRRLTALNRLGRALFDSGSNIPQILTELTTSLVDGMCDGCSVLLLPGELPQVEISKHRGDPHGAALSEIAAVADPVVHRFDSSDHARQVLPPAYASYVDRFGLRGLAILPFPILSPVQGVVTVTRDGGSDPFEPDDLSMIETCIEYAALAVQNAVRFETERTMRDQLNAVLANLPLGVIVTDAAHTITLANPAVRELLPELDRAPTLEDVVRFADLATIEGATLVDASWVTVPELVIRRPAGAVRVALLNVPLRNARGDRSGAVTVLQDVTAERAITAERDQVSRFMQRLLGIVGHDLRNPLGAFVAGVEMLRIRSEQHPQITPILDRLQSSTRRMTRIVDQLLDVTRASLGAGIHVEPREVDLVPLIESVIDEIKATQPNANVQLRSAGRIVGHWDPERLAQVISNLAGNAAHYGRAGAPITIDVGKQAETVTIAVHNAIHERPLPAQALATLFDPHARGTESHRNKAGLGLGLYIVKQIVRAHRGDVSATSDDAGTVFRVTLPA